MLQVACYNDIGRSKKKRHSSERQKHPMATATQKTNAKTDPKTRSLELATAHGETSCSHHAHTLGWTLDEETGALVSLALIIDSAHEPGVSYAVGYDARRDDASCDCKSAQYGGACHHRGLAILCGRSVAQCYAPAGRRQTRREQYINAQNAQE